MTENLHPIPIGEMIVSADPDDVLVVYGLGSCVVICLYDPVARVGGMLHALLPGSIWGHNGRNGQDKPTKFVNQGVPLLLGSLVELGIKSIRLDVSVCGGAQFVARAGFHHASPNIGERNVLAARMALQAAGLKVKAEAIGSDVGRTVKFHLATGQVTVKTLGQQEEFVLYRDARQCLMGCVPNLRHHIQLRHYLWQGIQHFQCFEQLFILAIL
jgi:chemotaxis protein CheD